MNKKQIFALAFFLIVAGVAVLSRRIPPIWLSILYFPYSWLATYVGYRLYPQDGKKSFADYVKRIYRFPQGIILTIMNIVVIWLLLQG